MDLAKASVPHASTKEPIEKTRASDLPALEAPSSDREALQHRCLPAKTHASQTGAPNKMITCAHKPVPVSTEIDQTSTGIRLAITLKRTCVHKNMYKTAPRHAHAKKHCNEPERTKQ